MQVESKDEMQVVPAEAKRTDQRGQAHLQGDVQPVDSNGRHGYYRGDLFW